MTLANWNGKQCELEKLMIPALDRAFLFGDAVYEVIKVHNNRPFLFQEHLTRLAASLQAIDIQFSLDTIKDRVTRLLETSPIEFGMIYLQITRGQGPRIHFPRERLKPNCLIYSQQLQSQDLEQKRKKGIKVLLTPEIRWSACHIKSTSLLGNVLGYKSARMQGFEEAIFVNQKQMIHEGSHSSLFMVKNGEIFVPPLSEQILPSITRKLLIHLAEKINFSVVQDFFDIEKLYAADEVFLAGTTSELLPVVQINETKVSYGKPGPISLTLYQQYRLILEQHWDSIA